MSSQFRLYLDVVASGAKQQTKWERTVSPCSTILPMIIAEVEEVYIFTCLNFRTFILCFVCQL